MMLADLSLSSFLKYDLPTVLVAIVVSVTCGVAGCFLVLRRQSLLGDAISHAVLPGIALAFLLTGQVSGMVMLLAAMLLGVFTAFLTQVVHESTGTTEDSSLGIVFTALFAVGVILIGVAARGNHGGQADLDPGCVLYGAIELVALDQSTWWGLPLPRVLPGMLLMLGLVLAFVLLCWKEMKLATFDAGLAQAMGYRPRLLHYLFIGLVAGVTVTSFEAVGSILVIAMLVVPAATAQLLAQRLSTMMLIAATAGALAATLGYFLALYSNTSAAGMMAVVAGGLFGLAWAVRAAWQSAGHANALFAEAGASSE